VACLAIEPMNKLLWSMVEQNTMIPGAAIDNQRYCNATDKFPFPSFVARHKILKMLHDVTPSSHFVFPEALWTLSISLYSLTAVTPLVVVSLQLQEFLRKVN